MPKARDPKRDEAEAMWKESGGQLDLVEIAARLNVSAGTVRGWKSKDKWDASLNGTLHKKERNAPKRKERSNPVLERSASPPEPMIENDDLTDKQRLFVKYYLISLNATEAAIKAGYSPKTAEQQGSRLLSVVKIKEAVQKEMRRREERIEISQDRVVQQLAKIAFADIKNVVTWDDEGSMRLRPSDEIDGTIMAEISETVSDAGRTRRYKLKDSMKALLKLYDHLSDEQKLRVDKLRAEVRRLEDKGEASDDGNVDQLTEMIRRSAALMQQRGDD